MRRKRTPDIGEVSASMKTRVRYDSAARLTYGYDHDEYDARVRYLLKSVIIRRLR